MDPSLATILRETYYNTFVPLIEDAKVQLQIPRDPASAEMASEESLAQMIAGIAMILSANGPDTVCRGLCERCNVLQAHATAGTKLGDLPEKDLFANDIAMLGSLGVGDISVLGADLVEPIYSAFRVLCMCVKEMIQLK